MNNRLKGLDFPLTLNTSSWSRRARITLALSCAQELEKNWKKLLSCCWTRRCERERRVESFYFFWCWSRRYEWERVLDCSSCFERVERRMRWSLFIAWPAKDWSLGFKRITCINMQNTLALHVLNFTWLHV